MVELLRDTFRNIRAGLAYQIVLIAIRIHPPLLKELVGMTVENLAKLPAEDTRP